MVRNNKAIHRGASCARPRRSGLFKCNRQRIAASPNLSRYLAKPYALPKLRGTVNLEQIKQLNPSGIDNSPPLFCSGRTKNRLHLTLPADLRMVKGLGGTLPGCSDLVPQEDRQEHYPV